MGGFPEALKECDSGLGVIPNDPLLLAFKVEIYLLLDKGRASDGGATRQ